MENWLSSGVRPLRVTHAPKDSLSPMHTLAIPNGLSGLRKKHLKLKEVGIRGKGVGVDLIEIDYICYEILKQL